MKFLRPCLLFGFLFFFSPACTLDQGNVYLPLPRLKNLGQAPSILRIMPLGDSITEGFPQLKGGYRAPLSQLLKKRVEMNPGNTPDFKFVGSLAEAPLKHEGHRGWLIGQISDSILKWMSDAAPELILLMIGTNDVIWGPTPTQAPERLEKLLFQITDKNPKIKVILAQIPRLEDPSMEARAQTYNASMPEIVKKFKSLGFDIELVDMHLALDLKDIGDRIHPTDLGYEKMANAWNAALK